MLYVPSTLFPKQNALDWCQGFLLRLVCSKNFLGLTVCMMFRWRSGGKFIAGPSFAVPLVGGVVSMVLDPHKFWRDQLK